MNLQYFIIGLLAFLMSCGLIPLPQAKAQFGDESLLYMTLSQNPLQATAQTQEPLSTLETITTEPPKAIDVNALFVQLLNTILGVLIAWGIPSLVLAWVLDFLVRLVPPLRAFRTAIFAFLNKKLEEWQMQQVKGVVLGFGQIYKNDVHANPDLLEGLKNERKANVIHELKARGIAKEDYDAEFLLENAVAQLKAQGVNP
jgi:hypothetical protein